MTDQELKGFLKSNMDLIEKNDLQKLYGRLPAEDRSELTQFFLEKAGVDPLMYLDKIPAGCFSGYESISEEIVIPDHIQLIDDDAFNSCANLIDVTIGKGVRRIGVTAFCGCLNLEKIIIPDSVVKIGSYAFESCINLESVQIGSGIENIGLFAFFDCPKLKNIVYKGTKDSFENRIGGGAGFRSIFDHSSTKVIHCTDGDIALL